MPQQGAADDSQVRLDLLPQPVDEDAVQLQDEQVHLEVLLLQNRVEELEKQPQLRKEGAEVFEALDGVVELLGALEAHPEVLIVTQLLNDAVVDGSVLHPAAGADSAAASSGGCILN